MIREIKFVRRSHIVPAFPFVDMDLDRVVVIHRGILDLQHQNLPNGVPHGLLSLVVQVLLQLHVHEKLGVGLAVHEILSDDVVGSVREVLIGNGLDLQAEVEAGEILEGNGGHPGHVLLGWDFDELGVFVWLEQILDGYDLGNLALGSNWDAVGSQVFQLDVQEA